MPRIVFARLKVKEQRQIVAGNTDDKPLTVLTGNPEDNPDIKEIGNNEGTSIFHKCGECGAIYKKCGPVHKGS